MGLLRMSDPIWRDVNANGMRQFPPPELRSLSVCECVSLPYVTVCVRLYEEEEFSEERESHHRLGGQIQSRRRRRRRTHQGRHWRSTGKRRQKRNLKLRN